MTGDLAVWLRAQLDAQEHWLRTDCDDFMDECQECAFAQQPGSPFSHAFTLADITAKRAIVELHRVIPSWGNRPCCEVCSAGGEYGVAGQFPCRTLRLLAQPYAGRPGWHNEWTTT